MDELDIKNYNNPVDLYDLLGVSSNIGDRELEAKILSMINQYKTAKATSSGNDEEYDKVINFMIEVYKYFFDNDNDIDEDGDGRGDVRNRNVNLKRKPYEDVTAEYDFNNTVDSSIRDFDKDTDNNNNLVAKIDDDAVASDAKFDTTTDRKEDSKDDNASKFTFSYPLNYAVDDNGNIINQATKRIVTINSNSRYNSTETTSSEFTINLSETLKNVVKLKLYSVSVPYSWYTISEDFGSNFFFIKGNAPGIFNPIHDIKLQIEPGNYDPESLISNLDNVIKRLKDEYTDGDDYIIDENIPLTDTSLNNTRIRYNSSSGKTKMFIDIKKNYDSNYFRIRFPKRTDVYKNNGDRNNDLSIPSFLGFTTDTLNTYTLRSSRTTTPSGNIFDASNHIIKILRYIGDIPTILSDTLSLINLKFDKDKNYDTNNDFDTVLTNLDKIDNNASRYVVDACGNYLKIRLVRDDAINNLNTKLIVLFPYNTDANTNIWTDTFGFETDEGDITYDGIKYTYKILNDIISQEPAVNDRIIVPSTREIKMEFTPIKPLYNGINENGVTLTDDISLNKFELLVPQKSGGYTTEEFIEKVNDEFDNINANYTDNHNTEIFNKNASNEAIMRIDDNRTINLDIDISFNLGYSNYLLDLSGTIMGKFLSQSDELSNIEDEFHNYDLSNNELIKTGDTITITKSAWTPQNNYFLVGDINKIDTPYVLKLKPKPDGHARNLPVINVELAPRYYVDEDITNDWIGTSIVDDNNVTGASALQYLIQESLNHFNDPSFNNPTLLEHCSISIESIGGGKSRFDLSLNVSDYLDETNYELRLTDTFSDDVWTNRFDLLLNHDYDLSSNSNIVSNTTGKTIDQDLINITTAGNQNQIIIEPIPMNIDGGSNGVFDTQNRNTTIINIPDGDYTRDELIAEINALLLVTATANNNILTNGMRFNTVEIDGEEHCKIDFNLDRMFRAQDYKVVFFDNTFSSCNIGATSIQNTTYDSTVGYILGYRDKTEYNLASVIDSARIDEKQFVSKQQLNVNLYNEFSVVLDDYNNNRLPSAIVSGEPPSTDFNVPSYANRAASKCDENGDLLLSLKGINGNTLTVKQLSAIYSNIETSQAKKSDIFKASQKVNAKDVFAIIPLNVSGLTAGELFVKEGITLQEQERSYFGPVDIQRISVKLLTDKGTLVNLNQSDWSFSFVCEQLHDKNLGQYITSSKDAGT